MSHAPRAALLLLLAAPSAAVTAQDADPIGTHGATIDLGAGWEQRRFDASFGPDQFVGKALNTGQCLQIAELEVLVEDEADFAAVLDRVRHVLEARAASVDAGRTRFERVGGVGIGTSSFDAEIRGITGAFRLQAVGRDGLAYLLIQWGPQSRRRVIDGEARRLARSLRMPDADSAWGRTATPRTHEIRGHGHVARFVARDSVLPPVEDARVDGVLLQSRDESCILRVEWHDWSGPIERLAEQIGAACADAGDVRKVQQERRQVDGRDALDTVFAVDADPALTAHVRVIRVTDALALEFRYVATGGPDRRPELLAGLRGSLHIEAVAAVDAFPPAPAPVPTLSRPGVRPLLDVARVVGEVPTVPSAVAPHPRGRLMVGYDGVRLLEDGAVVAAYVPGDYGERSAAWFGGRLWVATRDDGAAPVEGGVRGAPEFAARCLAAAGDRLFLTRSVDAWTLPGRWSAGVAVDRLIERGPSGERVVLEVRGRSIEHLAVEPSATCALIHVAVDWTWRDLSLVRLADGMTRSLGAWEIAATADAPGGFLVSGAPRGAIRGLYFVSIGGERELLVRGAGVVGLARRADGELWFTAPWDAPPGSGRPSMVWAVASAALRGLANPGEAFDPRTLRELGRAALADGDAGLDRWQAIVAAADRRAEELVGVRLPSTVADFDALHDACAADPALGHEGRTVLAALLVRCLVAEGARWVGSIAPPESPAYDAEQVPAEHAFAFACVPFRVVATALDSEGGWYAPARSIRERAAGRTILLGDDADALMAAASVLDATTALDAAVAAGAEALAEFLLRFPDNAFVRGAAYGRLGAIAGPASVCDVAARFAQRPDPAAIDVLAWCASRAARVQDGARDDALVEDLRAAIGGHPDELGLYLLLGEAYARSADADRARACFDHVLAERSWGDVADRAREGLERLAR